MSFAASSFAQTPFASLAVVASGNSFIDSITEDMVVNDANVFVAAFNVSQTENSNVADVLVTTSQFNVSILEDSAIADVATIALQFIASVVENVSLEDVQTVGTFVSVSISENFTVDDLSTGGLLLTLVINEDVVVGESQSILFTANYSVIEGFGIASIENAVSQYLISITEPLSIRDVIVLRSIWLVIPTDSNVVWNNINSNTSNLVWVTINTTSNAIWTDINTGQ
jgi:hypothetical protein